MRHGVRPAPCQRYSPQKGSSCTPTAIFYAYSVLTGAMSPVCPENVMQTVMDAAWGLYRLICARVRQSFLQQHEVLQSVSKPANISISERYVTKSKDLVTELAHGDKRHSCCLRFEEIFALASDDTALILTGSNHTTAVVNRGDCVYFFDSLPAAVYEVASSDELLNLLQMSHGRCYCMTLTVLTLTKPAS